MSNEPDAGASKAPSFKVELDIEDAPFLEEPKEAPAPAPEKKAAPERAAAADAESKDKKPGLMDRLRPLLADKKRLAIIGGAALGIIVAAVAVNIFLSDGKPPPEPVTAPTPEPQRVVLTGETPHTPADPGFQFAYKWDPFLIERRGSEGQVRFLRCSFTVPTNSPRLNAEMQAKKVVLRDAVFYYLTNKELMFLSDSARAEELKRDLISVINEHVATDKVTELYIEDYLIDP